MRRNRKLFFIDPAAATIPDPSMHTIERNNTISTTTDLRYQIPLPPGQCCFLQMSKDQGCFRTHNNIASKGRGEGRTRYSEDVRKNALRM